MCAPAVSLALMSDPVYDIGNPKPVMYVQGDGPFTRKNVFSLSKHDVNCISAGVKGMDQLMEVLCKKHRSWCFSAGFVALMRMGCYASPGHDASVVSLRPMHKESSYIYIYIYMCQPSCLDTTCAIIQDVSGPSPWLQPPDPAV